jgi:hypothetical protein
LGADGHEGTGLYKGDSSWLVWRYGVIYSLSLEPNTSRKTELLVSRRTAGAVEMLPWPESRFHSAIERTTPC